MSSDERVRADDDTEAEEDGANDGESGASVDVADDEDEAETGRPGSMENTTPPPHEEDADENGGDETVPTVELDLYDLSVRVSGQSTDDLDTVSEAARDLMAYLVDQSHVLEDRPDDRGLS